MAVATVSTFTVENHEGVLYNTSPTDTKFFSMLGGLFGGEPIGSIVIPWQEYSLRDAASDRQRTEGDDHPTSTKVTRSPVHNVLEIRHESIDTSWTKRATSRQLHAIGSNHPEIATTGLGNPVADEHSWQGSQQLKEVVRDMEYTLFNGSFVEPAVVGTARQTRGILEATSTNARTLSATGASSVTGSSSDDVIASSAHGLDNGDKVQFTALTGGTGITLNETYYVVNKTTNTFQIATEASGTPVTFADFTAGTYVIPNELTSTEILEIMQLAWENGGLQEQEMATVFCGAYSKRRLTDQFITQKNYREMSRTIAGVSVDTIITDFGELNVVLDRFIPKHAVSIVSMEECNLAYLQLDTGEKVRVRDLQDSGGSRDRTVLYFEWGLRYGNELKHAKLLGNATR